ncbi:MAG: Arabinose-proton symporter [bacterium ADurb.Bin478]|nr:MAG: Arabinose-proton symporter [bacterium ADurb.Bin478]
MAFYQLSIVIGILLSYYSNWWLLSFSQTHGQALMGWDLARRVMITEVWRAMFGAEMIPGILFLLLLFGIPESPRWLIAHGEAAEGRTILNRINGPETATAEWQEIQAALAEEEGTLAELLRPGLRRALLVGIGLSFFGQLTGVNIVIYYGPIVLEQAGVKLGGALSYQVIIGFINLIFTLLALWKIDRWGRRPLLVGGMGFVTLWLSIIALQFSLEVESALWIGVALCGYMACVAVSICAVIWVITGEIFPNRVRGRAMSIATFVNWATNFISVFLFPWYVARFGVHTGFFTFAAICLLATLFFAKSVPETKGKSLEQIERYWTSQSSEELK